VLDCKPGNICAAIYCVPDAGAVSFGINRLSSAQ